MKVLVTGARGQVGSELVRQGMKRGLQIIAAGHGELDITCKDAVSAFFSSQDPGLVINASAYTAVDKAEEESALAYAVNRDGPAHLAAECAQCGIPLLHISTDYIFDGTKEGPYCEDDQPNPLGIYGNSKLEGEKAVEASTGQHVILRVAGVFGSTGSNFVRTMLHLGSERDVLGVVSDQTGGPTWAGDIASVLLTIGERYRCGESIPWGVYNYTGAPVISWHGFAEAIFASAVTAKVLDKAPQIKAISSADYPALVKRPLNSMLDCRKIERELSIRQPDWRIGMKKVVNNWRQQRK